MMERYFKPPEFKGRPLNNILLTRGKRHYWGEKGKNYGFFTTAQENQMEGRRKQHRRIKSQAYDYLNDNSVRYNSRFDSRRTIHTEEVQVPFESQRKKRENKYVTIGVQSEENSIQTKEAGIQVELTLREQMQSCLDKPHPQNHFPGNVPKYNEQKNRLPQINQKSEQLKGQRYTRHKRLSLQNNEGSQLQVDSIPQRKQTIVYYKRKNRMNNPTYCNSIAYPLPCYRYIG